MVLSSLARLRPSGNRSARARVLFMMMSLQTNGDPLMRHVARTIRNSESAPLRTRVSRPEAKPVREFARSSITGEDKFSLRLADLGFTTLGGRCGRL